MMLTIWRSLHSCASGETAKGILWSGERLGTSLPGPARINAGPSFAIHYCMGKLTLIALAITMALFSRAAFTAAQTKDSAGISSATADVSDDPAFAGYQRVTAGMIPPKATHSPDPEYPDLPPDTEPSGVVVMLIGVDAHGRVKPVRVVRSSAAVFEKSAVTTVKTWRFKPAKKDGKPVPVKITVEMRFAK